MRAWILIVVGALLAVTGLVWTLQGLGMVGGSPMTGVATWAIIGPIVFVAAAVIASIGLRQLRNRPK
ncbi:hypothetical protein AB0I81_42925 [Nonomuraea sp. NPDC050404]|uniref:hypothetical protein n=1 Tax=Nonomuraea sp. NPDC050404 TaxID=3155783 RepID=UPI0033DA72C5